MWAVIAAVVITTAIAVMVMTRRNRGETIVLGRQMAAAAAAEAARLASGDVGPSLMPTGAYDQESGDYDFAAVTERPLDRELQTLVRAFKASSSETRVDSRRRISMDEQYTLIHFAKRSSVLALQQKSIVRCEDGLLALAMIDETRIDPRDASWAVGFLAHAIDTLRADREHVADQLVTLATPGMAKILMRVGEGSRLSDWGYVQIHTANGGVGLVRSGFAPYEPTIDMTALALRLAATLQRGRYIAEPELGAELPDVWFDKANRARAEQLLKTSRAGIAVHGTLRRAYTTNPLAQQFVQWVVEMSSAEDANALVQYVGVNARLDSRFVIGLASGRLFSLLVAGSSMQGVASFESAESLAAIEKETRAALHEAAP
jgi:hypothetical protein